MHRTQHVRCMRLADAANASLLEVAFNTHVVELVSKLQRCTAIMSKAGAL